MLAPLFLLRKILSYGLFLAGLALAYWAGAPMRQAAAPADTLKLVDSREGRVYVAQRGRQEIRVLSVRSGLSEIARLQTHSPVQGFAMDEAGAHLTVFTSESTQSFSLQTWLPLS